jgi:ATP-dependent DNA helicase RecQ
MKDQVENLQKRGINALSIHSGLSYYEVKQTLENAASGDFKFLYLSPERLETNLFKEYLHTLDICLIAVDEAHCISQWGFDFRPSYLRIVNLRNELPNVPIIALTASATTLVQDDIIIQLKLNNKLVFRQSFEKPNLSYSVFKVDSKINKVIEILTNVQGSSIVYCRNRRQTKNIAHLLILQNISADFYHAGLPQEERNQKQQDWIQNKTRVVVCTNAFGMGIDKPDVRTVIHYDVPDCLENYYQEAGRAGRDGQKAYAVLLYTQKDIDELKALPDVRFPIMYDIKKVYQALADFLHVAVGSGEGMYYDFDLLSFINNFKLDAFLVTAVLKVLEQEGHLSFNESVFHPSKVQFTAPKETLENFEQSHPNLEPIIKALLRSYEGIYDNMVSVYEKQLAKTIRSDVSAIKQQLQELQSYGIIQYRPQKETPQIHFILNRAPAQYLIINQQAYQKRKQLYSERIDKMLAYIQLNKQCRSQFVSAYFGDTEVPCCGICDVCLQQKNKSITPEEFTIIQQKIYTYLQAENCTVKGLLLFLKPINKEKIWQVLQFLQDEKKMVINNEGIINKM